MAEEQPERGLSPQLMAVIAAAVAAAMGVQPGDLRVRGIAAAPAAPPAQGPSPWALAGRLRLIDTRRRMQARRQPS